MKLSRFSSLLLILFLTSLLHLPGQVLTGRQANAQVPGSEIIRLSPKTSTLSYIRFRPEARPTRQQLLEKRPNWMPQNIQAADLIPQKSHQDKLGMTHTRYQIHHQGIPVEGAVLILHEQNGQIHSLNGDLYSLQGGNISPSITESQATAIAKAGRNLMLPLSNGTLAYAPLNGDFQHPEFRLAWKFDVYAHSPLYRAWVYVDAQTGQVIWEANRIHTADVTGTVLTRFSGTRTITTDSVSPNLYELHEAGRGGGIRTRNMQQGFSLGNSVAFTDADNYWNNVNPQWDEVAPDAHLAAEVSYDYYLQTYNWNSYDNQGAPILSYLHFSQGYDNAYWD